MTEQSNDIVKAQQNILRHLIFLFVQGSQPNPKDKLVDNRLNLLGQILLEEF
jgi:hypothetical protein